MFEKYLEDYYTLKISLKDICNLSGLSESTFYRYLESKKLFSRRAYYGLIDTGNKELNRNLKDKYASIVKRCTGKSSYQSKNYTGVNYLPVYEWVEFVMENKELLLDMWDKFIKENKNTRYSISIDRIDNNKGYFVSNMQFVTHGYNSWKRNTRPIKVTYRGEDNYFFSAEEASRFYNIRTKSIGEILRGKPRYDKEYKAVHSTVEDVFKHHNINSYKEYYKKIFK